MAPSSTTKTTRPARAEENIWAFQPGSLTIVDLSDPFFSEDDACTLFAICHSIFLEERNKCGRVIVLDEAHKFLNPTAVASARLLTNDLLSTIRQQRHTGTRVLIATQEPTLAPELIDLANVTLVHRFLSPSWFEILKKHLAGAKEDDGTLFSSIVSLRTGEALLFSPTAQMDIIESPDGVKTARSLGNGYAKIKIRKRFTADGGRSILATEATSRHSTNAHINEVLMHDVSKQQPPPARNVPNGTTNGATNGATNGLFNNPPQNSSKISNGTSNGVAPSGFANPSNNTARNPLRTTNNVNNSANNNIRHPQKNKPTAAQNKQEQPPLHSPEIPKYIREEVVRQGRALIQKERIVPFTGFTREEKEDLVLKVEGALKFPSGTMERNKAWLNVFHDRVLISELSQYSNAVNAGYKNQKFGR